MKTRYKVFYVVFCALMIILDQVTKYIVDVRLPYQKSQIIIDHFFYLTYTHNTGAAWSILSGANALFIVFALGACGGLIYLFTHTKPYEVFTRFGSILVIAGALGNCIDRFLYSYVRDFIDFIIFGYDFPIFNVADICVCVGVFFIFLEMFMEEVHLWKPSK